MSFSSANSSYAYRGLDRGLTDATVDRSLDEIPRAIAANERPTEFDRDAVGVERDAFDEERRGAATLVEKAGPSSPEEDGSRASARADDLCRSASTGVHIASRARDPWRAGPGRARRAGAPVRGGTARRLPWRSRSRYRSASPPRSPAPRRPPQWPIRGERNSRVSGRPRWRISSEKLARPAMSRSIRGCSTKVPRPRVRSIRPSRTSSSSARRTVIRLQP